MAVDYLDYAQQLKIVDVFKPGNPSGVVTDKRLYDPDVQGSRAPGSPNSNTARWPVDGKGRGMIMHATVGTNSLAYLAGGSILDGRWVSAHYLLSKDDYTVHKLIPDGFGANHCYPGTWRGYINNINSHFYGCEIENRQNSSDPFTFGQYVKASLVCAYLSARDGFEDRMIAPHGIVAPPGHRTDPYTGGVWDFALFYGVLSEIRQTKAIFDMWGLPQPVATWWAK